MDNLNEELIKKIKYKDELINIKNLYGVFLFDDNRFIISKEVTLDKPCLCEFSTMEIIDRSEIRFYKIVCPWRENAKNYSFVLNRMYFCFPLEILLNKYQKDGKVNKKELLYSYCVVNEYLKKNPEFIDKLIKKEKIR